MSMENSFKDLVGGGLEDFAPKPRHQQEALGEPVRAPSPKQLEQVAQTQGFGIDNHPLQRKLLRSGRTATKDRPQPMSLRIRVNDWNKFSAFCERNDYTVADGFAKLAEMADRL